LRANPAAQAAVRVQEGRLHRVLRLFAVAEQPEAVAEDPLRVPRVEVRGGVRLGRPRSLRNGGREGTHGRGTPSHFGSVFDFWQGGAGAPAVRAPAWGRISGEDWK